MAHEDSYVTDAWLNRRRPPVGTPKVDIHSEPQADISQAEVDKRILLLESALEGWLPQSPWGTRIRRGFERQLERLRAHGNI